MKTLPWGDGRVCWVEPAEEEPEWAVGDCVTPAPEAQIDDVKEGDLIRVVIDSRRDRVIRVTRLQAGS